MIDEKLLQDDSELARFFHRNTEINSLSLFSLQGRIEHALSDSWFEANCFVINSIYAKYNHAPIKLDDSLINDTFKSGLFRCLINRRTNSHLPQATQKLNFKIFSQLLRYSFGISKTSAINNGKGTQYRYTFPTEGGLNTIEVYVIVNNVENIPNGVYLYDPYSNVLRVVSQEFKQEDYKHVTGLMSQAKKSFFSVHFVGNGEFSFFKYGNRAYRLMNIEAGHCSQNLYLVSTVLGVECAASGAFLDDEFFDFLKIPHKNRFLLYENFVGE